MPTRLPQQAEGGARGAHQIRVHLVAVERLSLAQSPTHGRECVSTLDSRAGVAPGESLAFPCARQAQVVSHVLEDGAHAGGERGHADVTIDHAVAHLGHAFQHQVFLGIRGRCGNRRSGTWDVGGRHPGGQQGLL